MKGTAPQRKDLIPRVLFITQHRPDRVTAASELRSYHIRRALEEIGQVDVVVVDMEGNEENRAEGPGVYGKVFETLTARTQANKSLLQKIRWAFDPRGHFPQGLAVDSDASNCVFSLNGTYDLIWFNKIRTPHVFPRWNWPRSVLDIDDVPSTFETSVLQNGGDLRQRLMTRVRRSSWRRRERLLGERFTVLAVCSEEDRRYLLSIGANAPIHVIPNGAERPLQEPIRTPVTPPRIGFVGLFDYYPNLEGVEWFLKECWPWIKREVPNARLRLVGRHSNGPLKLLGRDIDWLGWVGDVDEEIATWSLMIVPLQKGAGTRGKIAFGFSRKCPIVSTSLGAYGYQLRNGEEIFLADTASAVAQACLRVIRNPGEAAMMAERASERFTREWTWDAIRPRVWATANDCLRRSANKLDESASVTTE